MWWGRYAFGGASGGALGMPTRRAFGGGLGRELYV